MSLVNIFTLNLDLKDNNYISGPTVTASDTVSFVVNVTDDGLPFDLTGMTTVTIAHTRSDGIVVIKTGTKTGINQVNFLFGSTEISVPGRVDAKVQMYDVSGRVSTLNFGYVVTEDPAGGSYVPSEDDKTLIEQVLGEGPIILANAEAATHNANTAATNANNAAANVQSAESTRVASENARVAQENTRKSNEITRGNNETSRVSVEAARVTAEASRVTKEISRVNVEAARVTSESSRVTTENTRVSQEAARVTTENTRVSQESARVVEESNRVIEEASRVDVEAARVTAEATRVSQETSRVNAEATRMIEEDNRDTQEIGRMDAEDTRVVAETDRDEQETVRNDAENTRQNNESTRQTQETARQNNTTEAIDNLNDLKDSFVYDKDPYSSTTNYKVNNQVSYNGTTYICILDSVGNPPTNTTYWRVFAMKGADGLGTVTSLTSTTGDIIIGGTPTNPDLSVNVGDNPNQIVKRDSNGDISGTVDAPISTDGSVIIGGEPKHPDLSINVGDGPNQIVKRDSNGDIFGSIVGTAIKAQAIAGSDAMIVLVDENGVPQGAFIWDHTTDTLRVRRYGSDGASPEGDLYINATQISFNGALLWSSGNDGPGSGLDADTLDGKHATTFALSSDLGDKATLLTTDKSDFVHAVNELFQSVSNGKTAVASAITGMGQSALGSETFSQLVTKILAISTDATAVAGDVLSGKTFYQGGNKKTGNIPVYNGNVEVAAFQYGKGTGDKLNVIPDFGYYNNGARSVANIPWKDNVNGNDGGSANWHAPYEVSPLPGNGVFLRPAPADGSFAVAYYGDCWLALRDPDYNPAYWRSDVNIFGVQGAMPVRVGPVEAIGTGQWPDGALAVYLPQGFYPSSEQNSELHVPTWLLQSADGDLQPWNIVEGANIYGVGGTAQNRASYFASGSTSLSVGFPQKDIGGLPFNPTRIIAITRLSGSPYQVNMHTLVGYSGMDRIRFETSDNNSSSTFISDMVVITGGGSFRVNNIESGHNFLEWYAWR